MGQSRLYVAIAFILSSTYLGHTNKITVYNEMPVNPPEGNRRLLTDSSAIVHMGSVKDSNERQSKGLLGSVLEGHGLGGGSQGGGESEENQDKGGNGGLVEGLLGGAVGGLLGRLEGLVGGLLSPVTHILGHSRSERSVEYMKKSQITKMPSGSIDDTYSEASFFKKLAPDSFGPGILKSRISPKIEGVTKEIDNESTGEDQEILVDVDDDVLKSNDNQMVNKEVKSCLDCGDVKSDDKYNYETYNNADNLRDLDTTILNSRSDFNENLEIQRDSDTETNVEEKIRLRFKRQLSDGSLDDANVSVLDSRKQSEENNAGDDATSETENNQIRLASDGGSERSRERSFGSLKNLELFKKNNYESNENKNKNSLENAIKINSGRANTEQNENSIVQKRTNKVNNDISFPKEENREKDNLGTLDVRASNEAKNNDRLIFNSVKSKEDASESMKNRGISNSHSFEVEEGPGNEEMDKRDGLDTKNNQQVARKGLGSRDGADTLEENNENLEKGEICNTDSLRSDEESIKCKMNKNEGRGDIPENASREQDKRKSESQNGFMPKEVINKGMAKKGNKNVNSLETEERYIVADIDKKMGNNKVDKEFNSVGTYYKNNVNIRNNHIESPDRFNHMHINGNNVKHEEINHAELKDISDKSSETEKREEVNIIQKVDPGVKGSSEIEKNKELENTDNEEISSISNEQEGSQKVKNKNILDSDLSGENIEIKKTDDIDSTRITGHVQNSDSSEEKNDGEDNERENSKDLWNENEENKNNIESGIISTKNEGRKFENIEASESRFLSFKDGESKEINNWDDDEETEGKGGKMSREMGENESTESGASKSQKEENKQMDNVDIEDTKNSCHENEENKRPKNMDCAESTAEIKKIESSSREISIKEEIDRDDNGGAAEENISESKEKNGSSENVSAKDTESYLGSNSNDLSDSEIDQGLGNKKTYDEHEDKYSNTDQDSKDSEGLASPSTSLENDNESSQRDGDSNYNDYSYFEDDFSENPESSKSDEEETHNDSSIEENVSMESSENRDKGKGQYYIPSPYSLNYNLGDIYRAVLNRMSWTPAYRYRPKSLFFRKRLSKVPYKRSIPHMQAKQFEMPFLPQYPSSIAGSDLYGSYAFAHSRPFFGGGEGLGVDEPIEGEEPMLEEPVEG